MLEKYINAAIKKEICDLVIKNATFVDVFNMEIKKGDIAIKDDRIVGIGNYKGKKEINGENKIIIPGLIDGHVHIESSTVSVEEFSKEILKRGTTTIIADPHEICNVIGVKGLDYIINASKNTPLTIKLQFPSCVPSSKFETSGAILDDKVVKEYIKNPNINGLGEFMDYQSVINAEKETINKLETTLNANKVIDGHAPLLKNEELNAYLCSGISTDHECVNGEEVLEKISKGMYVHLRIGSLAQALDFVHVINDFNYHRFMVCTDDKQISEILKNGHIDYIVKNLINAKLNPLIAISLATINIATCYKLDYVGAIAPFYKADLLMIDNFNDFNIKMVIKNGKIVVEDNEVLFDTSKRFLPDYVKDTILINELNEDDFKIKINSKKARAITLNPQTLITKEEIVEINNKNDDIDVSNADLSKLYVIERHGKNGNISKGLLKDYGFKGGAMGISCAHDSHNIILIGDDNKSLLLAVKELKRIGGGVVLVNKLENSVESIAFDIAGLMSSKDSHKYSEELEKLSKKAYKMGVNPFKIPFFSLSFLALPVIPHIRLLDKGLFDVDKFNYLSLEVKE